MYGTIEKLKQYLQAPKAADRSAPFWSWNGDLDWNILAEQAADMKAHGMGGFFIHSREGLETPYLSAEWMDCVERVLEKARTLGMSAWIYDDDKWPSGNAGGIVGQGGLSAKALTLEVLPQGAPSSDDVLKCVERKGETLVFRIESSGPSEWYNGSAPSDRLDKAATDKFLELTHEEYHKRLGKRMPQLVRGFFTDEPNFCDFFCAFPPGRPWLPWTGGFPGYFLEKRGYDILEKLPFLFYADTGCEKVRHDYWRTLTELFDEAYCKPVYDWCEAHGVLSTGHMLYENDLGYGARVCGAAMPHYRYFHVPGIDLLGEQIQETLTVRQCTSVANQMGREEVVTETYGCTGWGFTFQGQKRLMDWQFVQGVTLRCQHLAPYTIKGCRKRDYPPVFHYQNSWWAENNVLEGYGARLSRCVKSGRVCRDILVLHPMSTIWMHCGSSPKEDLSRVEMNMGWLDKHITCLNRMGAEYERAGRLLLGSHQDFDFGDETILAEMGQVDGNRLRVGKASYQVVVVPSVETLFSSTVELLKKFLKNGGKVLWTAPFPSCVDGEPSLEIRSLREYEGLVMLPDYEAIPNAVDQVLERTIRVSGADRPEDGDILTMVRKLSDGYFIFAVNTSPVPRWDRIWFAHEGRVEEMDLFTGTVYPVRAGGHTWVGEFAPYGSRAYFVHPEPRPATRPSFPYAHPHRADHVAACLGPVASFARTMENTLTLDVCAYRIGEGDWSQPMAVWHAQKEIRDILGMRQIYYNGAPQRYLWLKEPCDADGTPIRLRFHFQVKCLPEAIWIAVEDVERFQLTLNGQSCGGEPEGYLLDRCIKKFPLSGLRSGENELCISCQYTHDMELEDIYLTGDFAVDNTRAICAEPETLHFGDWCFQGYPNYAGGMVYRFPVMLRDVPQGRIWLKMGAYQATAGKVRVNGTLAGYLMGETLSKAEVTGLLQSGNNLVEIELIGSPRNLFGPFHQAYTGCSRISWEDFRTTGVFDTREEVLIPYGIFEQVVLCVTGLEGF